MLILVFFLLLLFCIVVFYCKYFVVFLFYVKLSNINSVNKLVDELSRQLSCSFFIKIFQDHPHFGDPIVFYFVCFPVFMAFGVC